MTPDSSPQSQYQKGEESGSARLCYSLIEKGLVAKKPGYHGAQLIEEPDKITDDKEDGKEEDEEGEGKR